MSKRKQREEVTGSFSFLVPVVVEIEDGLVRAVTVIDETDIENPAHIEGDPIEKLVAAAQDGQGWPSWEFGF